MAFLFIFYYLYLLASHLIFKSKATYQNYKAAISVLKRAQETFFNTKHILLSLTFNFLFEQ